MRKWEERWSESREREGVREWADSGSKRVGRKSGENEGVRECK